MGAGKYSDDVYKARVSWRTSTGTPTFKHYEDSVKSGVLKTHSTLEPKGVKFRESRDSVEHPESLAIAIFLDHTGSMSQVPEIIQKNLPSLMGLLLKKGYVEHPQIMFSAVGDAISDHCPLQVGQFESNLEMETNLTNFVLEGNGGDGLHESYELAMYFMTNHTSMDCLEKRGKKGYFFFILDEPPYEKVKKNEVKEIIGDNIQSDIVTDDIARELKEKFEVFVLIPAGTNHFGNRSIFQRWQSLFGPNVIQLQDPNLVSETIASLIGITEGKTDADIIETDLKDVGVDSKTIKAVTTAITPYISTKALSIKTGKVEGELPAPMREIGIEQV